MFDLEVPEPRIGLALYAALPFFLVTVPAAIAFLKIRRRWRWVLLPTTVVSLVFIVLVVVAYLGLLASLTIGTELKCYKVVDGRDVEAPCPTQLLEAVRPVDSLVEGRCFLIARGAGLEVPCPTPMPSPMPPPITPPAKPTEGRCYLLSRGKYLEVPCPTATPNPAWP